MCRIMDLDAVLLVPDLLIEVKRSQSAIRRFRIGMRLFKSATWPSIWLVHGSFSLSGLLALETRLAGELADRYVTRRETSPEWPSIEIVILEHSV